MERQILRIPDYMAPTGSADLDEFFYGEFPDPTLSLLHGENKNIPRGILEAACHHISYLGGSVLYLTWDPEWVPFFPGVVHDRTGISFYQEKKNSGILGAKAVSFESGYPVLIEAFKYQPNLVIMDSCTLAVSETSPEMKESQKLLETLSLWSRYMPHFTFLKTCPIVIVEGIEKTKMFSYWCHNKASVAKGEFENIFQVFVEKSHFSKWMPQDRFSLEVVRKTRMFHNLSDAIMSPNPNRKDWAELIS